MPTLRTEECLDMRHMTPFPDALLIAVDVLHASLASVAAFALRIPHSNFVSVIECRNRATSTTSNLSESLKD